MKPAMRVVQLQQQHIICSSPDGYAKGVSNSEGIDWKDGGFGDQDGLLRYYILYKKDEHDMLYLKGPTTTNVSVYHLILTI